MRKTTIPDRCTKLKSMVGVPCSYCHRRMTELGRTQVTQDHVFPKSQGFSFGRFEGRNKIWCCSRCNAGKSDMNILQWWFCLQGGKDPRTPIVFEIVREWYELGIIKPNHGTRTCRKRYGIKTKVFEKFIEEYKRQCLDEIQMLFAS
jgi:hypothetical protein